jgi:hypothetical protein
MTDTERYRTGLNLCAKMIIGAQSKEIRELWLTIERSYRFPLERAERIAKETA